MATTNITGGLLIDGAATSTTTAAMTLYVNDSTGNDNNPGTVAAPVKTIQAAFSKVPTILLHDVTINVAAGTYTGDVRLNTHAMSGRLYINGSLGVFVPAQGLATGTVASSSTWDYVVTGAGWAVNALKGKFIRLTSGASAGEIVPIHSNTADTLTLAQHTTWANYTIVNQTFEFVEVTTIFKETLGSIFAAFSLNVWGSMGGDSAGGYVGATIRNFDFQTTNTCYHCIETRGEVVFVGCRFPVSRNYVSWIQTYGEYVHFRGCRFENAVGVTYGSLNAYGVSSQLIMFNCSVEAGGNSFYIGGNGLCAINNSVCTGATVICGPQTSSIGFTRITGSVLAVSLNPRGIFEANNGCMIDNCTTAIDMRPQAAFFGTRCRIPSTITMTGNGVDFKVGASGNKSLADLSGAGYLAGGTADDILITYR